MFTETKAFSGFSVDDIDAAQRFYSDVLGLRTTSENGMLTLHLGGGGTVLVYPKPGHQPATFTVLNFPVPDIRSAVDTLTERGVEFERYDGIDQDDDGIARIADSPPITWFTDSAGNILAVLETS